MIKECHLALLKTQAHAERVPDFVYNVLYAYIVKYAVPIIRRANATNPRFFLNFLTSGLSHTPEEQQ